MAASSPLPPITLLPASAPDFYPIAALEAHVFYSEEFSAVAFGPTRDSRENLLLREKTLASQPKEKGSKNVITKAVILKESGEEELVGAAGWSFHLTREDGVVNGEIGEEGIGDGEGEKKENGWGEGANVKLCEDVFLGAEKHIARSTEGRNYASEFYSPFPSSHPRLTDGIELNTLVVSPEYQRRGIGKLLIEDGLKEADRLGLQAVLGASKEGLGLYKKHGFTEFEVMEVRLWEYEGGEGMGLDRHVVMHRPAVK